MSSTGSRSGSSRVEVVDIVVLESVVILVDIVVLETVVIVGAVVE